MRPRSLSRPLVAAAAAAAVLGTSLAAAAGPLPTLDPDVVPDAAQEAAGCDPTDPALCLFPFPNDRWTTPDSTTGTGLRIALPVTAMPRNGTDLASGDLGGEGKPVDPSEWNRNDGWSPGSMVLTFVPGLDLPQTWGTTDRAHSEVGLNEPDDYDHRDQVTDIPLSLEPDAPIQIINTSTGARHPFWSELDSHAQTEPGRRALILRPAVNFDPATRYVVVMQHLKDASGAEIAPTTAFAAQRDSETPGERMQRVFDDVEAAGVERSSLYQAWDFTVASERNLTERALHMRDEAFAGLGDHDLADRRVAGSSPEFTVDAVDERVDTWRDSRGAEQSQRVRRVEGRVSVPNFLDRVQQTDTQLGPQRLPFDAPIPGSRLLDTDLDGLPDQNPAQPVVRVPYVCDVPLDEGPSYSTMYGHGLLGTRDQIGDVKWPRREGFAGCALDWWGMATQDLPTVAAILADVSSFPSLPDRAQQGFLNFMFAQRASVHPRGFAAHPAFQQDGEPLLVVDDGDGTQAFYDGNSQGGIMGAPLTALSPDISRSILGVPGMNYSTLLNRSVDWEGAYGEAYYATYQDPLERQLVFALIQMLWDRGEGNGYGHALGARALPGSPPHEVMLQVAWSDHQVANIAAEVMARTAGAEIMDALPDGRHWDARHLQPFKAFPHRGSALVYWDSGNATPPNGNVPPTQGDDPHGDPRNEPAAGWQEARFLLTGEHVDVCSGAPYLTDDHPANGGTPSCREPNGTVGTFKPVGR
ncbi:MAG: hypothetical protein ACLGIG_04490 [Actinomycetes bacterium]